VEETSIFAVILLGTPLPPPPPPGFLAAVTREAEG
jgi:hypothetical protein